MLHAYKFLVLYSGESFSLSNALCAPALPGTTLNNAKKNMVFESPWFAPLRLKRMAHVVFCRNTPTSRTILRWSGFDHTLTMEQVSLGDRNLIFWKKEYSPVEICTISANGLRLQRRTTTTNTGINEKKSKYCTDDNKFVSHTKVETINGPWRQFI